jgi:hypothetical protein
MHILDTLSVATLSQDIGDAATQSRRDKANRTHTRKFPFFPRHKARRGIIKLYARATRLMNQTGPADREIDSKISRQIE